MAKVSREHVRWLVLTFAALGLRATSAIVRPPWHDEYFMVWLANGSWRHILDALRLDSGLPLLYAASKLLAVTWAWERFSQISVRQRGTLGLVLAVALACWSHAFRLILAGMLALAALGMAGEQRWPTLLAGAGGVAAHLPWVPSAVKQPPAATEWMVQAWQALPLSERLLAPFRLVLSCRRRLSPGCEPGAGRDLSCRPTGQLGLIARRCYQRRHAESTTSAHAIIEMIAPTTNCGGR